MTCNPDVLKSVPLFALLDAEESAVLAAQVELKEFAPRERIYKQGQPGARPTCCSPDRCASPRSSRGSAPRRRRTAAGRALL
jgi:hypothetical protein